MCIRASKVTVDSFVGTTVILYFKNYYKLIRKEFIKYYKLISLSYPFESNSPFSPTRMWTHEADK